MQTQQRATNATHPDARQVAVHLGVEQAGAHDVAGDSPRGQHLRHAEANVVDRRFRGAVGVSVLIIA